ncbi:hypothetical protein HOD38_00095 [archaeon]|jgi:hypothetical protein|nr:hypothetical protein [archaeon]MBT4396646.1 hypothetical protein [archaeon]MBT4441256.1 hypothetical protein [archaeon]
MVAATITRTIETAQPKCEIVVLTVSDGESYRSRKFENIQSAHVSSNKVSAVLTSVPSVEYNTSSAVVTVHWSEQTDQLATLVLWGN